MNAASQSERIFKKGDRVRITHCELDHTGCTGVYDGFTDRHRVILDNGGLFPVCAAVSVEHLEPLPSESAILSKVREELIGVASVVRDLIQRVEARQGELRQSSSQNGETK